MIDEGYTKFDVDWNDHQQVDCPEVAELDRWRGLLHDADLIGHYDELGIGYGNISVRIGGGMRFLISGTRTGRHRHTGPLHYALVTDVDISRNSVTCRGAVQASSESLTHAAIYELDPAIAAVVHVHSLALWKRLTGAKPTTDPAVPYGTPEMAREFGRLYRETDLADAGVAIMAGHEGGIVSFGANLQQATERVLSLHEGGD